MKKAFCLILSVLLTSMLCVVGSAQDVKSLVPSSRQSILSFDAGSAGAYGLDANGNEFYVSPEEILSRASSGGASTWQWNEGSPYTGQVTRGPNDWGTINPINKYAPMALVIVKYPNKAGYQSGSGFITGTRGLVTAAHVLYDFDTKAYASEVYVYLMENKGSCRKAYTLTGGWMIGANYKLNKDHADDWAIIQLPNPHKLTPAPLEANTASSLVGSDVETAGYVDVKELAERSLAEREKYRTNMRLIEGAGYVLEEVVRAGTDDQVLVTAPLFPGMSGGPMFFAGSSNRAAIGIMTGTHFLSDEIGYIVVINDWLVECFEMYGT